jgi:hypothetical protein
VSHSRLRNVYNSHARCHFPGCMVYIYAQYPCLVLHAIAYDVLYLCPGSPARVYDYAASMSGCDMPDRMICCIYARFHLPECMIMQHPCQVLTCQTVRYNAVCPVSPTTRLYDICSIHVRFHMSNCLIQRGICGEGNAASASEPFTCTGLLQDSGSWKSCCRTIS